MIKGILPTGSMPFIMSIKLEGGGGLHPTDACSEPRDTRDEFDSLPFDHADSLSPMESFTDTSTLRS